VITHQAEILSIESSVEWIEVSMHLKSLKNDIDQSIRILRTRAEDKIKRQCSEFVINQVHSELYKPLKSRINPIKEAILESLGIDNQIELELEITKLRHLLNVNPKERAVQKQLLELEDRVQIRSAVAAEVHVNKSSGKKGRIDILAVPFYDKDLGRILELKRPSLKVVVFKNAQRVSKLLKRTLIQIGEYQEAKLCVHSRPDELELRKLRKTIIAGRRLPSPDPYLLIAENEKTESVDIYSWDAWIDRFERINT
jgi:hypothetical protein